MLSLCLAALLSYPSADFDIKDGDRIVMVGGALIEREQQYGYVESMMHTFYRNKKFTVRNLGWSGDTVWGEARAGFGTQKDGYKKLVEQVKACKPTVLILGYGTNEAFAGKTGVEKFATQYRQFLADVTTTETRCCIFLTIPSPKNANVSIQINLAPYDATIERLAKECNGTVINLKNLFHRSIFQPSLQCTDDGILPNENGYSLLAIKIACGNPQMRDDLLNDLQNDLKRNPFPDTKTPLLLELRQLIRKKNELYFHQYRPQNDTYLFLFRKHEQGNNAAEIPKFTPLIEELDKQINELKARK